ncbi:MAG: cysteine--tRNA ligase, partial [Planctomycetes bacterium]|nr:cysteine--tRNA ligase [Planctomycetota bacterium]
TVKRYLTYKGFEVTLVINITDVDDKIIAQAKLQNRPMEQIAREVEEDYLKCIKALGVNSVDVFPRATEHIDKIIELIQRLIDKNAAYVVGGDVYFDHTAAKDYGKLSGRKVDQAMHGWRDLSGENKRHPADFALWKAAKPDEPSWESPWGKGRPGWHIECSAMSMAYLGETFDIHGGGVDLIFPHHENEIAQSETATGKPFAKYWMHNGLTRVKTRLPSGQWQDEKMSKSLGNVREINDLLKDYTGETIRAFILSTHYRRPLEFSDEQLAAAGKSLETFYRLFDRIERITGKDVYAGGETLEKFVDTTQNETDKTFVKEVLQQKLKFHEAMDDDFNTAGAIAALHSIAGAINRYLDQSGVEKTREKQQEVLLAAAGVTLVQTARILGLFETRPQSPAVEEINTDEIERLVAQRSQARKEKDFARADKIRDQLMQMGIILEDTPSGTIWRKKSR